MPRHRFVSAAQAYSAYDDGPLPIGSGQTISQPYMVARMTELLALSRTSRVLEVGTGSGYQTAVLAELADRVWTIERIPELADRAREVLHLLGYTQIEVIAGDGSLGYAEAAPYDAILVTAGAPSVPPALREQMAVHGKMVIPVAAGPSQELLLIERTDEGPTAVDDRGAGGVSPVPRDPGAELRLCASRRREGLRGMTEPGLVRLRVLAEGRVQGVGFRYGAYQAAQTLGVQGWARNLPDGRVEVSHRRAPGRGGTHVGVDQRGPCLSPGHRDQRHGRGSAKREGLRHQLMSKPLAYSEQMGSSPQAQ